MKYTRYVFVIFIIILSTNKISFAGGKIVGYFLNNPNAWDRTKRITHNTPTKVVVEDGLKGLEFNLTHLTNGDEVALIFLETKEVIKLRHEDFCHAGDKLLPGRNRIVSIITKNYGKRTKFHYEFMLQKNINNVTVKTYNDGDAVLESKYDGSMAVEDDSNLSGIALCEIEVR
ncbi:MAG: hypothetical protein ACYSR0_08105 [Planctomycetota bacterium]|jgi:hypothetical protein